MDYTDSLMEIKQEIGNLQSSMEGIRYLVYFLLALNVKEKYLKRK